MTDAYPQSSYDSLNDFRPENTSLYWAVTRTLRQSECQLHARHFQYFYQNQLLCPQCFTRELEMQRQAGAELNESKVRHISSLKTILDHPVILQMSQQELTSCSSDLLSSMLHSYKSIYSQKSDLKLQRTTLQSLLNSLQSRIQSLCQSILSQFDQMSGSLQRQMILSEEMLSLNDTYERYLCQTLGEQWSSGSISDLEALLADFKAQGTSPFHKMHANLEEMMSCIIQSPIINLDHLIQVYTTVTDQKVWKCDRAITSHKQEIKDSQAAQHLFLKGTSVRLQGVYTLQCTQSSIQLLKDEEVIGRIDSHYDECYSLPGYQILAVKYDAVQVISYFQGLSIRQEYPIKGCMEVLVLDEFVALINQEELIRLDLVNNKLEAMGKGYSELSAVPDTSYEFECESEEGWRVRWNIREKKQLSYDR